MQDSSKTKIQQKKVHEQLEMVDLYTCGKIEIVKIVERDYMITDLERNSLCVHQ